MTLSRWLLLQYMNLWGSSFITELTVISYNRRIVLAAYTYIIYITNSTILFLILGIPEEIELVM